ncbi:tRNA (adenosine(37)-N6)-threonylcarbamoyltransferase complex transferase subunit TsaD, partial [Acinetobacter baumannii]
MPVYLGVETSCDETAAAVVRDGREVLSSCLVSQVDLHKTFGGVVPEVAARKHLETVNHVVAEAVDKSGLQL